MVVAADNPGLERYLKDVTAHMQSWLMRGQLQQLTLVLCNKITREVLERWVFMIETDEELVQGAKYVSLFRRRHSPVSHEVTIFVDSDNTYSFPLLLPVLMNVYIPVIRSSPTLVHAAGHPRRSP